MFPCYPAPWARRGGWTGEIGLHAVLMDGSAAPLTPSLGSLQMKSLTSKDA